jgi:hypothetical protein
VEDVSNMCLLHLYSFYMRANFSLGQKPITGFSVADPDPRSGAFLIPGSGMGKKIRIRDPRINNPGHVFQRALKPIFWVKILIFFDADPG